MKILKLYKKPKKDYTVYVYEFNLGYEKYAYIGLTKNPTTRHRNHMKSNSSSVNRFMSEHNIEEAEMKMLSDNLNSAEAQVKESEWLSYYKSQGWVILNKAKVGLNVSSIGSVSHNPLVFAELKGETLPDITYVPVKEIGADIIETVSDIPQTKDEKDYSKCEAAAKECKSLVEFRTKYPTLYQKATKHKWLDDFNWLKRNSKDPCKGKRVNREEYDKAINNNGIKTRSALHHYSHILYNAAQTNGWINDTFPKKAGIVLSDTEVEDVIKQISKFENRQQLRLENPRLYNIARKAKLLERIPQKSKKVRGTIIEPANVEEADIRADWVKSLSLTDVWVDKNTNLAYRRKPNYTRRLRLQSNRDGIVSVNVYSNDHSLNCLLIECLNPSSNCVVYADGNYSNISPENITLEYVDLSGFVEVVEIADVLLSKDCRAYSTKHKTMLPTHQSQNGNVYYGSYNLSVLSEKYFGIHESSIFTEGLNSFEGSNVFVNKSRGELHVLLKDSDDFIEVGVLCHDDNVMLVKGHLDTLCAANPQVTDWLPSFIEDVFSLIIESEKICDVNITAAMYSNGTFWDENDKRWKSTITKNNTTYLLGTFTQYKPAQIIFSVAKLMNENGKLLDWVNNHLRTYAESLAQLFGENTDACTAIGQNNVVTLKIETDDSVRRGYQQKMSEIEKKLNTLVKTTMFKTKTQYDTEVLKQQSAKQREQGMFSRLDEPNYIVNSYGSAVFAIKYSDGKTYYLGSFKDPDIIKELDELMNERKLNDSDFPAWFKNFKENEYLAYYRRDKLWRNEHLYTDSDNYHWFAPRQCWRVKKKVGSILYLLGYFKEKKCCDAIVAEFETAVKLGSFEEWYQNIKEHRYRIKMLYNDPSLSSFATRQHNKLKTEESLDKPKIKYCPNMSMRPHIRQLDTDGNIIAVFTTLMEAGKAVSEAKNADKSIAKCCNGRQKTYKGFQWEYF